MKRRTPVLFGVSVVAALGIGWLGGAAMQSPEDARLPEPETPLVTAVVKESALTSTIQAPGAVQVASTAEVSLTAPDGREGVVSGTPVNPGQQVSWCKPLLEVAGRPAFALHGAVPAYRALREGDTGSDVRQLQQALSDCGYPVGGVDGVFGSKLATAIRTLYRNAGFPPPTATIDVTSPVSEQPAPTAAPVDGTGGEGIAPAAPATSREIVAVPINEVVFLPSDGQVTSVAPVGSRLDDEPVVRVATSGFVVAARIAPVDRLDLQAGMEATITIGSANLTATLPPLPDTATRDETTGETYYLVAIPVPDALDPAAAGSEARVSVQIGADAVYPLVVPATAVYAESSGGSYVLVAGGNERVTVRVDESRGGFAAVTAIDGELAAGDEVVLGG